MICTIVYGNTYNTDESGCKAVLLCTLAGHVTDISMDERHTDALLVTCHTSRLITGLAI